jgi:hypothetical protein
VTRSAVAAISARVFVAVESTDILGIPHVGSEKSEKHSRASARAGTGSA